MEKKLRFYRDLNTLRIKTDKDSVYFILNSITQKINQIWITNSQNIPKQVELNGTILPQSLVSAQTDNELYLSLVDGKLQVNPLTSPNGNISIIKTSSETQIQIESSLLLQINNALQVGDNISNLVNDAGYITSEDIVVFNPTDYDLEDFTNLAVDPFAKISDINSVTNLSYIATSTQGTVANDVGTSAIIPLANLVDAGLLSPVDKIKLNNLTGSNSGDSAVNTTSNTYSDGKVSDEIVDGVTTIAPSQNSVFDALALKANGIGVANGINSGDQTSIVGISGTKAQYNTSLTDGDFLFTGDVINYTNEEAQDAVGTILADSATIDFTYEDLTPSISAIVKPNSIDSTHLGNSINVSEFINDANYTSTAYVDSLVVGLLDDRGSYDASGNTFPITGGSGTSGAILKGDVWYVSVAGILAGKVVNTGDSFRALMDNPAQVATKWSVLEANIGYVPENVDNKASNVALGISNILYPTQNAVKTYADSKVTQTIINGITITAPSENAVFDALVLKYDASNPNGYETPAELNIRDVNNRNRANHTGTQIAATISDFTLSARVAVVDDFITNGVIDKSPSENAVFDALVLKYDASNPSGYISDTNLFYTPSPINGIVISDKGSDATIPLADGTNAGLITSTEKTNIATAIQPAALNNYVPYIGALTNVDLGEFQAKVGQLELDQTPTGTFTPGKIRWNDSDGTIEVMLKGGNVTLQVGQEQVLRVVNKTGSNLLESQYKCVYISGSQGNRLKVDLALSNNSVNSSKTIGIVTENINNNLEGFVTTSGLVRGINTTGTLQSETWVDGDILYLSATITGGITNILPVSPNHKVLVGYVVNTHITQGAIFVKVDTGLALHELHNVNVVGSTINKVVGSTTEGLWENKTISQILGYTPENTANKQNSLITDGTGIKYPTVDAVNARFSIAGTVTSVTNSDGTITITGTATTPIVARTEISGDVVIPTGSNVAIIASTIVKSVVLNTPNVIFSTPINFTTATNTATGTLALNTQLSNTFLAGATSGGAATPTFRAIVASDVPTLNQNTTGNAATATALQTARTIGTVTGDMTSTGSSFNGSSNNTNPIILNTVNSNIGTFGSTSSVNTITVNAKGLLTAITNSPIQITESQVTNLVSDLSLKANLASPNLTGIPTAPTATTGTNTTQLATTAFVLANSPSNVVTLNEAQTITGAKIFTAANTEFGNQITHHYQNSTANSISWKITELGASQGAFSIGTNTVNMSMRESSPRFISVSVPIESPNGTAINHLVNLSQVPIQLKDFFVDVNNVSITETDLFTYTTAVNRLNSTGEKLIASYAGTFNDGTAASQLKVLYSGNIIGDTGALTMSVTGAWIINVSIMRTGTTTARSAVNISTPGASTASYTKYTSITGLDFTSTNIIKITGTASGATGGSNDITATYGNIIWQPAAI